MVDCYSEPLLFVEASAVRPWQILHANDPALRITGEEDMLVLSQPAIGLLRIGLLRVCSGKRHQCASILLVLGTFPNASNPKNSCKA